MKYLLPLLLCLGLCADELTITNHQQEGQPDYQTIAGKLPIFDHDDEEAVANLFFVAYHAEGKPHRPVTFVFPGGPGGAGAIESIIAFGPKRILLPEEGGSVLPPYALIDNPESLLDVTDLVYIDPVNCGLSRVAEGADKLDFCGTEIDLDVLAEFIHNYLSFFQRWNSPKYLMGSSYGTLRCCGVAERLLSRDIYVHGLILEGCAFQDATLSGERDYDLPDCLLIPTMAATAWYHGRLWPERPLEEVVHEAKQFMQRQCSLKSFCPSCFTSEETETYFQQLAFFSGLPLSTVQRYNGRIDELIFSTEFFAPERKVVGGRDSRYIGDVSYINPFNMWDASYNDIGGLCATFNNYLQQDLEYDLQWNRYIGFSHETFHHWDRGTYDSPTSNFLHRLRNVLVVHPQLKIWVGAGYYDCRTPFAAAEYCFDHLELPESYKKNVSIHYYEVGHGTVFDLSSVQKMRKDLAPFFD